MSKNLPVVIIECKKLIERKDRKKCRKRAIWQNTDQNLAAHLMDRKG